MMSPYTFRITMSCWLAGVCLLIAPALGTAQNVPRGSAGVKAPSAKREIKTERQKWTALRDANRLSQMAEAYEKQGKAADAERSAEEALALEQQVRGPWHTGVAQRLDQVADLYTAHKKERAAEPLYERARAIRERAVSAHPDVYESEGGELRPKRSQPAEKVPTKPAPPAARKP